MKYIKVILPLFAVLARSVPVEYNSNIPTSEISSEDMVVIGAKINDLFSAFDAAKIDIANFYCRAFQFSDTDKPVPNSELQGKIDDFQNYLDRWAASADEFICFQFMERIHPGAKNGPLPEINEEDMVAINEEYENLNDAFAAATINPVDFYCPDDTLANSVKPDADLLNKIEHFENYLDKWVLFPEEFFCPYYKAANSLKKKYDKSGVN